jgi:hypothetical protein
MLIVSIDIPFLSIRLENVKEKERQVNSTKAYATNDRIPAEFSTGVTLDLKTYLQNMPK